MPELGKQISFVSLLETCQRIEVPQLQRDYAQGRDTAKEIRDGFLDAIHGALLRTRDDQVLPLNLDFVYGSMEENRGKFFLPLDGQQRLTTLFLLHWYLAWRDGALASFQAIVWDGRRSRFSYAVRPSSSEFFDELARFGPDVSPDQVFSVRRLLENQPWFYLHWRLDPTIQSALTMLDAIHGRFGKSEGLFSQLLDKERPAITFQLLPLEHFGLSDDLYIKMNARGKPLTPFETFKARFEQHLKELYPSALRHLGGTAIPIHDFFSRRMDTRWADFFWSYRTPTSAVFDSAVMNLFWIVAWTSVDPDRPLARDASIARYRLGVGNFTDFHDLGLLTGAFADNLICLLEAWSTGGGRLRPQLPDARYFDETAFFAKASASPTSLQYTDLLLFAAFTSYLRINQGNVNATELHEWMRVAFNLIQNSDIERPEEFERSLSGLQKLLPHGRDILPHLATMETEPLGFSREQVQEESLKARLILAQKDWTDRIHTAEGHGYFQGQIGFLLDFSGARSHAKDRAAEDWPSSEHAELQGRFDEYLAKAKLTFSDRGLAILPGERDQWRRSLLAVGNYLVCLGRNYSFVTDPPSNPDSWKRLLRGGTTASSGREHLKTLWDRLDLSSDVGPQLARIRDTVELEPWRAAIVAHPEVIEYCGEREIRWEQGANEIYLLKRRQMNGAHAELFTFVLHIELDTKSERDLLAPLQLAPYQSVTMTDTEPHVSLVFGSANFVVISANDQFRIAVLRTGLAAIPGAETMLIDDLGFNQDDTILKRFVPRSETRDVLSQLAGGLRSLTPA
jgi:hypothetical protein